MAAHDKTFVQKQRLTDQIVENICVRMAALNWSLKMLSDTADIPYETVKKLINGKIQKPSFYCIWQIAGALGCSVDDLASDGEQADPLSSHLSDNSQEISRILTDLEAILGLTDN